MLGSIFLEMILLLSNGPDNICCTWQRQVIVSAIITGGK